jgi:hypothetical protein
VFAVGYDPQGLAVADGAIYVSAYRSDSLGPAAQWYFAIAGLDAPAADTAEVTARTFNNVRITPSAKHEKRALKRS